MDDNAVAELQPMTLEHLRAAKRAGGVDSVTLKAEGAAFYILLATRAGETGVLVTTRDKRQRRFSDLRQALRLLKDVGILTSQIDARHWNPDQADTGRRRPDRAAALKRAHEAAAHDRWFRTQLQEAIREADDPATVMIPHETVMAEVSAVIDRLSHLRAD